MLAYSLLLAEMQLPPMPVHQLLPSMHVLTSVLLLLPSHPHVAVVVDVAVVVASLVLSVGRLRTSMAWVPLEVGAGGVAGVSTRVSAAPALMISATSARVMGTGRMSAPTRGVGSRQLPSG
jgi:hypothetical protein